MISEAVRMLSKNADFPLEKIERLACGTSTPDQFIPNHALMVDGELGISPCEVIRILKKLESMRSTQSLNTVGNHKKNYWLTFSFVII